MSNRIHSFRFLSLVLIVAFTLGLVGLANAQTTSNYGSRIVALQETPAATPIDTETPVVLEFGKAATTPLTVDAPHRYFKFKGTANQFVELVVQKLSGNMAIRVTLSDQSGSEIANLFGVYMTKLSLVTKLPQDGNYQAYVAYDNPGSGDFEAGEASVTVSEAKPDAAPTASK